VINAVDRPGNSRKEQVRSVIHDVTSLPDGGDDPAHTRAPIPVFRPASASAAQLPGGTTRTWMERTSLVPVVAWILATRSASRKRSWVAHAGSETATTKVP
jgi:hypothetical protein